MAGMPQSFPTLFSMANSAYNIRHARFFPAIIRRSDGKEDARAASGGHEQQAPRLTIPLRRFPKSLVYTEDVLCR